MSDPIMQHLYVMQNEFGCIKVGRSVDPWERRLSLRQTEHCRVELIACFDGGGEDEEAIHWHLRKHHLTGEWFSGTKAARAAVGRIFKPNQIDWQFEHDPVGAAEWLNHLQVVRTANKIRNRVSREITLLRDATDPSWIYDGAVFLISYFDKTRSYPAVSISKHEGRPTYIWHNPETGECIPVPLYTSSLADALSAWPNDLRPTSWEGTPIECCAAALRAIRSRLPKVPKRT